MKASWLLCLLVLKTLVLNVYSVRCRLCARARTREECQGFAECADDEECFLDQIITGLLDTVYVGGCRAKNVCGSASSTVIGKRDLVPRAVGDFVTCSRCCTGTYCNEKLCGLPIDSTLTHCYACGGRGGIGSVPPVKYPEDCAHETVCQHDEICHKLMNATFEVEDATRVGRYTTPICAVCCGDDYCNGYACETVKRRIIRLREDKILDYENLKEDIWAGFGK